MLQDIVGQFPPGFHNVKCGRKIISKFMWYTENIMGNSGRRRLSEEDESKMLDKILEEDKKEAMDEETKSDTSIAEEDPPRICDCMRVAEHSSRFSLRVMEAMRSLQRKEDAFLPSCTAEDIVRYIEANYRDDGDLYAQVRTALKQVRSQGFVMELVENEYHLVGPDAISMNKVTCSSQRTDCLLSSTPKPPSKRQRKDKDDCICEVSVDEESKLEKSRRKSQRKARGRKATRRNRTTERIIDMEMGKDLDEVEEESIIDPDFDDEHHVLDDIKETTKKSGSGEGGTKDSGSAGYSPLNFFWRRNTRNQERSARRGSDGGRIRAATVRNEMSRQWKHNEDDNVTEGMTSDNLDNIDQEPQNRTQRKKNNEREKELVRWIKRCQAECVRRSKRRTNH